MENYPLITKTYYHFFVFFLDTSSSLNFVAEEERYNRQGAINRQRIDDDINDYTNSFNNINNYNQIKITTPTTTKTTTPTNYTPSYLNLACCVNGYSNLTTYDSIFRKNLNKSPTPIAIPTTKEPARSNFLNTMDHHNQSSMDTVDRSTTTTKYDLITKITTNTNSTSKVETKSFVQQRVERLYGADALAQGILSPRPVKTTTYTNGTTKSTTLHNTSADENSFDLPVFRHLRPEFRAQLPVSVSPKKEVNKTQSSPLLIITNNNNNTSNTNNNLKPQLQIIQSDLLEEKQHTNGTTLNSNSKSLFVASEEEEEEEEKMTQKAANGTASTSDTTVTTNLTSSTDKTASLTTPSQPSSKIVKDGNYFLQLVEAEQSRLLNLAKNIENELDDLLVSFFIYTFC